MLSALAVIALIVGVVLLIAGYTVKPQLVSPGWGCVILFVVLVIVLAVLPSLHGAPALG